MRLLIQLQKIIVPDENAFGSQSGFVGRIRDDNVRLEN